MSSQGSYDWQGPGRSGINEGGDSEEQKSVDSFGHDDFEKQVSVDSFRYVHPDEMQVIVDNVGNDDSEEQESDDSYWYADSEERVRDDLVGDDDSEEQVSDDSSTDDDSAKSSHSQHPLNVAELAEASDETEAEVGDDVKLSPMRIVKIDTNPFVKEKTIDEMNNLSIAEDIIRTIIVKKPKIATEPWAEASETRSKSYVRASTSHESNCSGSFADKLVYQELQFKREIHKRLSYENVNFKLKLFEVKRPAEMSTITKLLKKVLTEESWEKVKKENETVSYLLFFYRNIETKSDTSTERVIKPEIFTLCTGFSARRVLKYADENFSKTVERRILQFPFQHVVVTKDSGPIKREAKFARPGREILFSVWDCLDNIVGNRTRKLKEDSSLYSSSLKRAFWSKTGKKLATSIDVTEKGMKIRRSLTIPQIGLVLIHFSKICLNEQTFLEGESGNRDEEVDDPKFEMHNFYSKIEEKNLCADLDRALHRVLQNGMKGEPTNLHLEHSDYEKWIKSEKICLYANRSLIRSKGATKRTRRANIKTWDQPPRLDEILQVLKKNYNGADFQKHWLDDVSIKFSEKMFPLKEFICTRLSLRKIGTYIYHHGTWLEMSAHYLCLIEESFVQKMSDHFIEASKLHLLPWKNIPSKEKKGRNDTNKKRTPEKEKKEKKSFAIASTEEDKEKEYVFSTSFTNEEKSQTNNATSSRNKERAMTNIATPFFTNEEKAQTNVAISSTKEAEAKTNVATSSTSEEKAKTNVHSSSIKEEKTKTRAAAPYSKTRAGKKEISSMYQIPEKIDIMKESKKWKDHFESLLNNDTFENVQAELENLASVRYLEVTSEVETTAAKVAAYLYLLHECTLREGDYNASHALLNRLLNGTGTKMITCDKMEPYGIELCDILIWDDNTSTTYLVHVKAGFDGDHFRAVCSQIRNAADHIYREQTISEGTGIIKTYWEKLTSPLRKGFHEEETKRVLVTMGEQKFTELFHSKRDIVFVLACRDTRKTEGFGREAQRFRDSKVNMTDEIKDHFKQEGDDVINRMKSEGYLTENGCLTDKFILDGKLSKTNFKEKIKCLPEIGSLDAAEEIFKIFTKNLSKSKATIAKMEFIRLVADFERYNIGDKQFQLKLCSIDDSF